VLFLHVFQRIFHVILSSFFDTFVASKWLVEFVPSILTSFCLCTLLGLPVTNQGSPKTGPHVPPGRSKAGDGDGQPASCGAGPARQNPDRFSRRRAGPGLWRHKAAATSTHPLPGRGLRLCNIKMASASRSIQVGYHWWKGLSRIFHCGIFHCGKWMRVGER